MSLCILMYRRLFGVPDEILDEELQNGPEVKIDILDEGYWSPELFWEYRVTTSVTERCFGGPDKRWGALWAKGRGHISPLRGCAPLPPHLT